MKKDAHEPATHEEDAQRGNDQPEAWTRARAEVVLRRTGLGPVLDEPPSEMSKYYVTNAFTVFNDPLAPFRKAFAPLAETDVRDSLEMAEAEGVFSHGDGKDKTDIEEEHGR